jgi:hypothetical protein
LLTGGIAEHVLEHQIAGRVAGLVVLLGELSELLVVVEHADRVHETVAAFAFHDALDIVPLERRAEHAEHPVDFRVAGDVRALQREVVHVGREILFADVMQVPAFLDEHFRAAGVDAGRAVGADARAAVNFWTSVASAPGSTTTNVCGKPAVFCP